MWLQMVANGCIWLQMVAYGCKWLQMVANGCIWLHGCMVYIVEMGRLSGQRRSKGDGTHCAQESCVKV